MTTLNDCFKACQRLRWEFPDKDYVVVFDGGEPRIMEGG